MHDYLPHKKRGTYVKVIKLAADEGRIEKMWRARELVYREPGYWVLVDGNVIRLDERGRYIRNPAAAGDDPDPGHFEELRLETDMRPVDLESSDRDIPYLSWGELRDQYKRRPYLTHLEVKLHQRFAFPLANFILLLLGFPFILRGENKSVILGVGAAVGIAGDPRGMFGERLGVNIHLITAGSGPVRNLRSCIERCHLDVTDFVVSPYASGLATLAPDEMELGVTVIDMGGGTTTIAVFLGGSVPEREMTRAAASIPIRPEIRLIVPPNLRK